jgi:assimilatory nitrate reductase catalytic subunit
VLRKLYPRHAYIELHPADAAPLGIRTGDAVVVESRRGRARVQAILSRGVSPGQAFMPMHYSETNCLTLPHFDPHSRQPSYKDCAVRVSLAGGKELSS